MRTLVPQILTRSEKNVIKLLNLAYPLATHLLEPFWREQNLKLKEPSVGFCYIGAEAAYHMLGGRDEGYKPNYAVYYEDSVRMTHWWLTSGARRVDPTLNQYVRFQEKPPYHLGKSSGFLTLQPSKRAAILMEIAKGLDL